MSTYHQELYAPTIDEFDKESGVALLSGSFRQTKKFHISAWFWNIVILAISIFLFIISILILRKASSLNCIIQNTTFSPALEIIDQEYKTLRWEASGNVTSPYRGPPSSSVDAAWIRVTNSLGVGGLGPISVSEEDLAKINAPKWPVRIPDEVGGGYLGSLEFVHQLHCLDSLRKQLYPEYYKKFVNSEGWAQHQDHCVETLRQKLMCDADTSIFTYSWIVGHELPEENMNVEHKCRDFDKILDWAYAHQVAAPSGGKFVRQGDWREFEFAPHDP